MSEKQQRLILSIIDFLSHSINDGIIREKDRGDLDVAIRRIGGAFGLDPTDQEQMGRLSVKPATLEDIFEGFFKTKDKICSTAQVLPSTSSGLVCVPSAEDKATADKYKREGNALLISKQYDKAIHAYTEAIKLGPSNPVYYSNRAVAHSGKREHLMATVDAEKAIELDPKYTKGYSRLGQAQYSIGNYAAAAHAYRRGLELEPNNVAMQAGLLNCDAQTMNVVSGITTPAVASTGGSGRFADMEREMLAVFATDLPDLVMAVNNNPTKKHMTLQAFQQVMDNGYDELVEMVSSNPGLRDFILDSIRDESQLAQILMSGSEFQPFRELFRDRVSRSTPH